MSAVKVFPRRLNLSSLKAKMLRWRERNLSSRDWRRRHAKVFKLHPEYRRHKLAQDLEGAHLTKWRKLRKDANSNTLQICSAISGATDVNIVPEEVFVSEIEPCLNNFSESTFLAHKSFYNRWFEAGVFPNDIFHIIDGEARDNRYARIDDDQVNMLIEATDFPVVVKPSWGSGGGRDVYFPDDADGLRCLISKLSDCVVQEMLVQDEFFARFNRGKGLNTLRVAVYRSCVDNSMHVVSVALRMGKGGSLDNETDGGIVCYVFGDGRLNSYAVDKYGGKYHRHPDSGVIFADAGHIPEYDVMKEIACRVAGDVYGTRLVSLDMTYTEEKQWRVLELNLLKQTIRFSQYAGIPFFKEFTDEVIDYCLQNKF